MGGSDRLEVRLPPASPIVAYENNGYRLEVESGRAVITTRLEPIASSYPFTLPPARHPADPVERLSRALTADAEGRYAAVSRVLGWIGDHVRYRLDRGAEQSPHAVLARRDAYCTGAARLAVAMLEAVGIEAREVSGLLFEPATADGELEAGFHRWIEVYYPDRGWVFSDPLASHHFVAATYVRIEGERAAADLPARIRVVGRDSRLLAIDDYPPARGAIVARKNHDRQLAGAVRVELDASIAAAADALALEGRGLRRSRPLEEGVATFTGIEPGSYTVTLLNGDSPLAEGRLSITDRRRLLLRIPGCAAGVKPNGDRPCTVSTRDGS